MNKVSRLAARRLAGFVVVSVLLGPAGPIGCAGSSVVGIGTTLSSTADALGTLVKRAMNESEKAGRQPARRDDGPVKPHVKPPPADPPDPAERI